MNPRSRGDGPHDTSLLHKVRRIVRRLGIDLARYPQEHPAYRRMQLLRHHGISNVLDVGANVGQYATELRSLGYKGYIISFEPLSSPFAQLALRASRDPSWQAVRTALGNTDGIATINVARNSVSSSMLPMLDRHVLAAPSSGYVATEDVPVTTVDAVAPQYISDRDNVYLKVDAQGFTKQVLDGAEEVLGVAAGAQLELSLVPVYEGDFLFSDALSYMAQRGFALMGLESGFTDQHTGQTLQIDALFFR